MKSLTTTVVICTYSAQRFNQLKASVESVKDQLTVCDQLIVVVDHNEKLLRQVTTELEDLTVLPNSGASGLSGARNTGINAATGDIVMFLDDDATAEPTWLGYLLAPYADPQVLGVGGVALPVWEQSKPVWWPAEFNWVVGCSYVGQPLHSAPIRNLMGCNMSLRRSVLQAVGGFDSTLGRQSVGAAGCEETELCLRVSQHFAESIFIHEPAAVVHHQVPAARGTWAYFRTRCYAEGRSKAIMVHSVGSTVHALSSERTYIRSVLPAAIARSLRGAKRRGAQPRSAALAIAWGLIVTGAGFLHGRWLLRGRAEKCPYVPPVLPLLVDLQENQLDPGNIPDPLVHKHLWCLVTQQGDPVTKLKLELSGDQRLEASTVHHLVRRQLQDQSGVQPTTSRTSNLAAQTAPCTVVVATRNRPEMLTECLDSILAGKLAPELLIVVDNAPGDERTAKLVTERAATDSRLRYVRENRPGLAHAHNAALGLITTALVAFTDDDVLADSRWLQRLARAFDKHPDAVCVTGLIAPRELETLPQQWVEGNQTYDKGLRVVEFALAGERRSHPLLPYASGACGSGANMSFRTDYLLQAGGFDTALGTGTVSLGGDDLAAFHDVLATGHQLVYEPAAIVLHPHHREYAALRRQMYGYGAGLGAHLMRCALRDRHMLPQLASRAVATMTRARRIFNPPAPEGLPDWPKDLLRAHRLGLLSGPGRYLLSRYRLRRRTQLDGAR